MTLRAKLFPHRVAVLVAVAVSITSYACVAQTQSSSSSDAVRAVTPAITPAATTNVTTTGGTSGQVPMFNGTSSVVNSVIFANATGIGVNRGPATGAALDVLGTTIYRGIMDLSRTADATPAAGANSFPFRFNTSEYNTHKAADLGAYFQFQAEPTGNNTMTTGATLNLLYNAGNVATESETGLSINGNGTINFAPGQVFSAGAPMCIATAGGFGSGGTTFIGPSFTVPAANGCVPWSGFTKTASTVVLTTGGTACVSSDGLKLTVSVSSADPDFFGAGVQQSDYIQVSRANTSSQFTNGGTDQGEFSGSATQVSCTASLLTLPATHD